MQTLKRVIARLETAPQTSLMLMLFLLGIALYAGTAGHDFVLDDHAIFTKHAYVAKGIRGIPEIVGTPYWQGFKPAANGIYRPLPLILFALLKEVFDATPLSGHLLAILLYGCCPVLLFRFVLRQFGRETQAMAFFAAGLFLVHPVHTEVVNSVKSCDETLSFIFVMLTLISMGRFAETNSRKSLAGGLLCCFLAMLSKESAVALALIAPLCVWQVSRRRTKRVLIAGAGVIVMICLYLAIRAQVLGRWESAAFAPTIADNSLAAASGFSERLANSFMLLGRYLRLLVVPAPLISDYSYNTLPLSDWNDPAIWTSVLVYAGLLLLGVRSTLVRRNDPVGHGILFYLFSIALFSNLFFLIGATFGERFLFLPSAGFCIAVAGLAFRKSGIGAASAQAAAPAIILSAAILVFTTMSLARSADWKNDETLFTADIEKAPENYRLPYYLATGYIVQSTQTTDPAFRNTLLQQAVPLLRQSIANFGDFPETQGELGSIYMHLGLADSGYVYNRRALELNPRDSFTRNNVAAYFFMRGDYREAIRLSRVNIGMYPGSRQSYANIGASFMKLGMPDSAITALQTAWKLEPGNARTGYFLNVAFSMRGQADSASRYAAYAGPGGR